VIRPLAQIGYNVNFTVRDLKRAGGAALVFAAVGVPLGLITRFIAWNPPPAFNVDRAVLQFVGIYLLFALPNALVFHGLLQNLVEKRFREQQAALLVAALAYGASHLNVAPTPNYLYALLSTIAGLAYGWVWANTRKITATALTCTLIEWARAMLFAA
jgi:membrane protease YdiL (CAAX protease family)